MGVAATALLKPPHPYVHPTLILLVHPTPIPLVHPTPILLVHPTPILLVPRPPNPVKQEFGRSASSPLPLHLHPFSPSLQCPRPASASAPPYSASAPPPSATAPPPSATAPPPCYCPLLPLLPLLMPPLPLLMPFPPPSSPSSLCLCTPSPPPSSPRKPQVSSLSGPVAVIVCTPTRLLQHIAEGSVYYRDVRWLVVDEADTIFSQGWGEEVRGGGAEGGWGGRQAPSSYRAGVRRYEADGLGAGGRVEGRRE